MNRIAPLDPTQGHGILEVGAPPRSSATTSAVRTKRQGNPSEAELIERVLRGDEEAFRELVRPCEHAVFMATKVILNNEADAEDAAQEAVVKAFTNLAKFRGDSKFSTWLVRIATNEALMKLRKQRHQKLHDSLDEQREAEEGDYVPRDFADWREIPSEALEKSEFREILAKALASLGQKYREVFLLRDVEHMSIEETAKVLSISVASVKTRLLRARLMLRDILAPAFADGWFSRTPFGKGSKPW